MPSCICCGCSGTACQFTLVYSEKDYAYDKHKLYVLKSILKRHNATLVKYLVFRLDSLSVGNKSMLKFKRELYSRLPGESLEFVGVKLLLTGVYLTAQKVPLCVHVWCQWPLTKCRYLMTWVVACCLQRRILFTVFTNYYHIVPICSVPPSLKFSL